MTARRLGCMAVALVGSGSLLLFCGDHSGYSLVDASADAADEQVTASDAGFALSLSPAHVVADPGDTNIDITIDVVRAPSFTDDVAFTITSAPNITTSNPPNTGIGGTSSSFSMAVTSNAQPGDVSLVVTGRDPTQHVVQATLGVHVGSLVDFVDGGFVMPGYSNALVVTAWGAGGGGGGGCTNCVNDQSAEWGGPGAAGGFAYATIPVAPGSHLVTVVGTGGAGGPGSTSYTQAWGGGGGGGFTALKIEGGPYLLIAGGGGGGSSSCTFGIGEPGGAGGGVVGGDGYSGVFQCHALGGTQTEGGAGCDAGTGGSSGGPYQGGDGYAPAGAPALGGVPGGGKGGTASASDAGGGGGGGGGGYFGGGGGGGSGVTTNLGSGGGGSGWISGDAGTMVPGNGRAPELGPMEYSLCEPDAGWGGQAGATNGSAGSPGGPGCIVVRLAKP